MKTLVMEARHPVPTGREPKGDDSASARPSNGKADQGRTTEQGHNKMKMNVLAAGSKLCFAVFRAPVRKKVTSQNQLFSKVTSEKLEKVTSDNKSHKRVSPRSAMEDLLEVEYSAVHDGVSNLSQTLLGYSILWYRKKLQIPSITFQS